MTDSQLNTKKLATTKENRIDNRASRQASAAPPTAYISDNIIARDAFLCLLWLPDARSVKGDRYAQ